MGPAGWSGASVPWVATKNEAHTAREKMEQVFTTDEDDGFITVDNEWLGKRVCTYIANQQPVLGHVRSWKPAESLVQQAFKAVDADGSGLLDRDEIRVLLESLGKRPTEADVDEAMAQLDADGSGEVDFAEFSCTFSGACSLYAVARRLTLELALHSVLGVTLRFR